MRLLYFIFILFFIDFQKGMSIEEMEKELAEGNQGVQIVKEVGFCFCYIWCSLYLVWWQALSIFFFFFEFLNMVLHASFFLRKDEH